MQSLYAAQDIAHIAASAGAPREIAGAIQKASARAGVDFSYLLNQAKVESSFNPDAKAKSSSATGLYQFIESTWLRMVETHGAKYGLGKEAGAISQRADGSFEVSSPAMRKQILSLRKDPEIAAAMAAEFAAENRDFLENRVGGDIGATEMYMAHFMGASGAAQFLNEMQDNPNAQAAAHFPKAAQANRNVFYDPKTGAPRTLAQVYDFFDKKFTSLSSSTSHAETPAAGLAKSSGQIAADGGFGHFLRASDVQDNKRQMIAAMMALPAPLSDLPATSQAAMSDSPFSFLGGRLANPFDLILEAQKNTYTGT